MAYDMRGAEREFWETRYWQAVVERETAMDGAVYYGVVSTGVYCRPSCASRKPRRENVLFFRRREDAETGGFRPCRRCRPDEAPGNPRLDLVLAVCRFLEGHADAPVSLAALGRELGYSPFHIQRSFKAMLGVSPRAWADERRLERFKEQVRGGASVTNALYDAGYGSSSRLYTGSSAQLGMTPAAYRKGGAGLEIRFTMVESAAGTVLVAATGKGVCAIRFKGSETALRGEFPGATVTRDDAALAPYAGVLKAAIEGAADANSLPLDIRATAFQRRVWEALRAIPRGETRSYAEIAQAVGNPRAVRAVARACATNPVAIAIPCHRVVRKGGDLGGYRWGIARKRALLKAERR
jgi:AraC family transcriptional regulator, regulatory protein of adaptative response / methylated-DNA-[protein]-cysteine methyltransferase